MRMRAIHYYVVYTETTSSALILLRSRASPRPASALERVNQSKHLGTASLFAMLGFPARTHRVFMSSSVASLVCSPRHELMSRATSRQVHATLSIFPLTHS